MKKLLLFLFCLLAVGATTFTAHAEEITETLVASNFKSSSGSTASGTSYATYYYTSDNTGIQYEGLFAVNTSKSFQMNSSSSRTPYITITSNKEGYKVGKINFTLDSATSNSSKGVITAYGNNQAYTSATIKSGTAMSDKITPSNLAVNLNNEYEFFSIVNTTNGALYFTKIEITYYKEDENPDPSVIKMSASDLSIAFHETKSLDNITFTPELTTGDLYELNFSGDFGDGLSFEKNADGEYTVFGNKTGTYNVNVDFNGLGGSVEGKTGSASFDVTVGRDPSTFAEYTLVTDLDQIGESANILIAYASGTTADLMGSTIKSGYVEPTDISSYYDSTAKSFKEDESYSPFIIEVNPDVPGELFMKMMNRSII